MEKSMIFHGTDLSQYELKNDIMINIETDLAISQCKDQYMFGHDTIQKNNFNVSYYYKGDYYIPVNYSGTNLAEGNAVLSASGDNFSTISNVTTGLTGNYYLFATAKPQLSIAVELENNGGNYTKPTDGMATIETKVKVAQNEGENANLQYAWHTSQTEVPTDWTNFYNETTLIKNDCDVGTYYLWIQAQDGTGNEGEDNQWVSEGFFVK